MYNKEKDQEKKQTDAGLKLGATGLEGKICELSTIAWRKRKALATRLQAHKPANKWMHKHF